MKRLNFDVDDDFHAKLKAYCARKGVEMKEEVVELLSLVLEGDQPREEERGEAKEPSRRDFVEPDKGATEEKPEWERKFEEYKKKYWATDVDERLRKIEADIKALKEDRTELWNYINKRTEKIPELTETVARIDEFLQEFRAHVTLKKSG